MSNPATSSANYNTEFLAGGGELGQMIRDYDWSASPLGPVDSWPQSLRTCVRIMLTSRQPIWIGWGKQLIKLYNDPYKAIVGGKHPWALGEPAAVVWKDIWRDIEPMLKQVMEEDQGTYVESQLLIMERNGYPEETYYTFSYTPIPGDDGTTAGMICANSDDTDRIISERQLRTLTQLGKNLKDVKANADVISATITTLKDNPHDFPFAIFYTMAADNKAILSATTPLEGASAHIPQEIVLHTDATYGTVLEAAVATRTLQLVTEVQAKVGIMPKGAWEIATNNAIILPIVQTGAKEAYGFLVVGLNPYRLLDDKYSDFFSLVADQIATSFSDVHVLEEERKRADALAEIDRAKTTFFSNISHEFRTPLTLLLGPIEDALDDPDTIPKNRERIELAHRNVLRMQKLVNTLLDFSRIEAGRMDGVFTAVNIGAFTEDLASNFRAAIEKAGMALQVQLHEVKSTVYVDTDMWEKIILNLLSNAFKYSKQGIIRVEVSEAGNSIHVSVTDSGIGIPEEHLDQIFNRFHRIEHSEGRSQEGTGIGLAMVKELVRLHGGTIEVHSQPGKGSTFTVSIPTGKDHLPANKIKEHTTDITTTAQSKAFIQEAMKWLPTDETEGHEKEAGTDTNTKSTILLADDNADMREYVKRLLSDRFQVITTTNGEEAYQKALLHRPELVLTDIMMPVLDGFGLLQKLRAHSELKSIPVIFLSARAGEESKVEGLDASADDYLVKPFSAKELMVRVTNHIRISQVRRESESRLEELVTERTVELQRSNEDLQQFAHVASHDLKEPARKIKTFSGRLSTEFGDILTEKGKLYIEKIQTATDRMYSMIEGVLNYSTLNASQQSIEAINLNSIIDSIETDLELMIQQKNALIQKEHLLTIEGASVLVYQLFYNLVNNSLKFSRPNVPPVITITSAIDPANQGMIQIILQDNGIGFDQQYANNIFNTFTRLNSKDDFEGTGLGLALCKKIVERHHGKITATGIQNQGAAFSIWMPIKQASKQI